MTESAPGEAYVIDDPAVLRVVSNPLRFRLLLLTAEPRTVTELAEELGLPRGRLYYHVHRLEEHGLIEVAGEHNAGTRTEHSYRALHTAFRLSPTLRGHPLTRPRAPLAGAVQDSVDRQLAALAGPAAPDPAVHPSLFVSRNRALSPERAEEFRARLTDLVEEFFGDDTAEHASGTDRSAHDGEGTWYTTTVLSTPAPGPVAPERTMVARGDT